MKTNIGNRIRELRRTAKLTQEQLAERMSLESNEKITRGAVGNWELGGGISTENLLALARIFNARVEWITQGGGSVAIDHVVKAYGHAMGGKDGEFILNGMLIRLTHTATRASVLVMGNPALSGGRHGSFLL